MLKSKWQIFQIIRFNFAKFKVFHLQIHKYSNNLTRYVFEELCNLFDFEMLQPYFLMNKRSQKSLSLHFRRLNVLK